MEHTLRDDLDRVVVLERLEGEEGPEPVVQGHVALLVEQRGLKSGERGWVDLSHHGLQEVEESKD